MNPEELNNIEMLLEAEKKLADKLSLHVEQAVEVEETGEQFQPWTMAKEETDLDCGELFEININP